MEERGCLTANENRDYSWVVTTEGPRGPKCTKSTDALDGLSARNGRVSSRALENTSAGALRKSTRTLIRALGLYKESRARFKKESAYTQQYEINTNVA